MLGDSLTAAYGIAVDQGFPAQLERALEAEGYGCEVLDAGVSGDTSAGGLARLDWMLADGPSHVILELGANDGLRGLPTEQMEANLDAIITRLKEAGPTGFVDGHAAAAQSWQGLFRFFRTCFQRVIGTS